MPEAGAQHSGHQVLGHSSGAVHMLCRTALCLLLFGSPLVPKMETLLSELPGQCICPDC